MPRISKVMIFWLLVVPIQHALGALCGQTYIFALSGSSSREITRNSTPQNTPCVGQPKSRNELRAAFNRGRFPLASQLSGTWVQIGEVSEYPSSPRYRSLNCSGVRRSAKFEFVLVANGYSVELHAIGMTYPQTVIMQPNGKQSVELQVDFSADEGPVLYRCRLSKRDTLVCLDGAYSGMELKRIAIQKERIYEVSKGP